MKEGPRPRATAGGRGDDPGETGRTESRGGGRRALTVTTARQYEAGTWQELEDGPTGNGRVPVKL